MTCREFATFIMDYVSAELARATCVRASSDTSRGARTASGTSQYRATVSAGRAAFQDPDGAIPADVPKNLVEAILAARKAR